MSFSRILFEADQRGIALITVNRPEKLNALDRKTIGELNDAFESVESSRHLKGLILTGADGKAFVAGADLQEIAALLPSDAEQVSRLGPGRVSSSRSDAQTLRRRHQRLRFGRRFGTGHVLYHSGGCLRGQTRPARSEARNRSRLWRNAAVAAVGRAGESGSICFLTGEPIGAEEAHRIGLVNHVVPAANLLEFSRAWLEKVFANGPARRWD